MAPKAIILAYHRVAETSTDPQLLCVKPSRFSEQLEILRRVYPPISLTTLTETNRQGKLPDRAAVVTFDDGYADNLLNAAPLLAAAAVPATVFVVAGRPESNQPEAQARECRPAASREFWWDELDRLLLQPGTLPRILRLDIDGEAREWNLGDAASYSQQTFEHFRRWSVLDRQDPTPRHAIYRELHERLRPLPPAQRWEILDAIRVWADVPPGVRPSHRSLSVDEIVSLADYGVEVGAHTVSHPVLASLPVERQRSEIVESKQRLEEILGRPVGSFSYPYGTKGDYTLATIRLVQEAGFTSACANFPGLVGPDADPYQLPRVLVRDWDGDEFARRLHDVWSRYS